MASPVFEAEGVVFHCGQTLRGCATASACSRRRRHRVAGPQRARTTAGSTSCRRSPGCARRTGTGTPGPAIVGLTLETARRTSSGPGWRHGVPDPRQRRHARCAAASPSPSSRSTAAPRATTCSASSRPTSVGIPVVAARPAGTHRARGRVPRRPRRRPLDRSRRRRDVLVRRPGLRARDGRHHARRALRRVAATPSATSVPPRRARRRSRRHPLCTKGHHDDLGRSRAAGRAARRPAVTPSARSTCTATRPRRPCVQAAERADSPVFLQVGRAIVPHMGLRAAYELTRRAADESGAETGDPPRPRPLGRGLRGHQARLPLDHVRRRAPAVRGEHQAPRGTSWRSRTRSASPSRRSWARSRTPTRRSTGSRTTPTSPRRSASWRRPASTGWRSRSASCTACR